MVAQLRWTSIGLACLLLVSTVTVSTQQVPSGLLLCQHEVQYIKLHYMTCVVEPNRPLDVQTIRALTESYTDGSKFGFHITCKEGGAIRLPWPFSAKNLVHLKVANCIIEGFISEMRSIHHHANELRDLSIENSTLKVTTKELYDTMYNNIDIPRSYSCGIPDIFSLNFRNVHYELPNLNDPTENAIGDTAPSNRGLVSARMRATKNHWNGIGDTDTAPSNRGLMSARMKATKNHWNGMGDTDTAPSNRGLMSARMKATKNHGNGIGDTDTAPSNRGLMSARMKATNNHGNGIGDTDTAPSNRGLVSARIKATKNHGNGIGDTATVPPSLAIMSARMKAAGTLYKFLANRPVCVYHELMYLYESGNSRIAPLYTIFNTSIVQFHRLKIYTLQNNGFTAVPYIFRSLSLKYLPYLEILDLADNDISSPLGFNFTGLHSLKPLRVDLRRNNITDFSMPDHILRGLTYQGNIYLDLSENPLVCSCTLYRYAYHLYSLSTGRDMVAKWLLSGLRCRHESKWQLLVSHIDETDLGYRLCGYAVNNGDVNE